MRKLKLAVCATLIPLAVVAMTVVSTEMVHAEETIQSVATGTDAVTVAGGRTARHYDRATDGGIWDGKQYVLDGQVITDAFFCDGTYTYYLQLDGTPMKDRLTYHPDGKHVIYFDADGHEVFSDFANVKQSVSGDPVDDNCFFNTFGYMYVNKLTYDKSGEKLYYINEYGVIEQKGWFQFPDQIEGIDGQTQDMDGRYGYGNADGSLMTNQWTYNWNGQLVYLQGDGSMATGIVYVDGAYNYFDASDGHFIQKYDALNENYITTRHLGDGGSIISEYDANNRLVCRDKYNYMNMWVNHKEYTYDEDGENISEYEKYYDYATGNYYEVTTTFTYDEQGRLVDKLLNASMSQIEYKYQYYDSGRMAFMSYTWKMNGLYADYTETFYNDDAENTVSAKKMYDVITCEAFTPNRIQEDYFEGDNIIKQTITWYDENRAQTERKESVYEYTDAVVTKTEKSYDADNNYTGKLISTYDREEEYETVKYYDVDGNFLKEEHYSHRLY